MFVDDSIAHQRRAREELLVSWEDREIRRNKYLLETETHIRTNRMSDSGFRRSKTLPDFHRGSFALPKSLSNRSIFSSGSPQLSLVERYTRWIQILLYICLGLMVSGALVVYVRSPHIHLGGARKGHSKYWSYQVVLKEEHYEKDGGNGHVSNQMIPFAKPYLSVSVMKALTFHYDRAVPLYSAEAPPAPKDQDVYSNMRRHVEESGVTLGEVCPSSESVRVFVGIASRASVNALAKRNAIRNSWMIDIHEKYSEFVRGEFLVSQPSSESKDDLVDIADDLIEEYKTYGDIAIVPGPENYMALPTKTFSMMRYALSSTCEFTHILKTDDDVYLRVGYLLQIIQEGLHHGTLRINARTALDSYIWKHDDKDSMISTPWTSHMYLGKVDRNVSGVFPGFVPVRDPKNKWYLSEEAYPDELGPENIRWISGWGYLMSRDVTEHLMQRAGLIASSSPENRPPWWGKLPWEDVVVATLLSDYTKLYQHDGFKAAWDSCKNDTVLKHLDNQAPTLVSGLREQDKNGLWTVKEVVCSAGLYKAGSYNQWKSWRNSLPDALTVGMM